MGNHGRHPFGRTTTVNVAIPPMHRPLYGPKIGTCAIQHILAKGRTSCLITNQRSVNITPLFQACRKGRAYRLLSFTQINTADNFTCLVKTAQFVLKNASCQHGTKYAPHMVAIQTLVEPFGVVIHIKSTDSFG